MAYNKQTWINNQTVVTAAHMQHIEDGIETVETVLEENVTRLSEDIAQLSEEIANKADKSAVDSLSEDIKELSTYVTPEMYGAVGDGVADDTEAIQAAINSGKPVIGYNKYLTKGTLNIPNNYTVLKLQKLDYTGSEAAVYIPSSYNDIHIFILRSESRGIVVESNGTTIQQNVIRVHSGICIGECIYFNSISAGIVYNKIIFDLLKSRGECNTIMMQTNTTGTTFIGENSIYGGKLEDGNYGIYLDGGKENAFPAIKIYNVCFEGVSNAIYFKNVEASVILYPRFAELKDNGGIVLALAGKSKSNRLVATTQAFPTSFDFTNLNVNYNQKNVLDLPIAKSDGVIFADGAYVFDGCIMPWFNPKIKRLNVRDESNPLYVFRNADGAYNDNYGNYFNCDTSGTSEIYLGAEFNTRGVTVFYVKAETGVPVKVYKADKVVFELDGTQGGLWRVTIVQGVYSSNVEYFKEKLE